MLPQRLGQCERGIGGHLIGFPRAHFVPYPCVSVIFWNNGYINAMIFEPAFSRVDGVNFDDLMV